MPAPDKYAGFDAYIGLDAMSAYMKGLAARLPVDGRAGLRLGKKYARSLYRLSAASMDFGPLADNIKWISAMADRMARERAVRLPSSFKTPRVSIIAGEVVSHSDGMVSPEMMTCALKAFGDVQGLNMDEIWLFPRAVSIELMEAFTSTAQRVTEACRHAGDAERWARDGADMGKIASRDSAFFERALKTLADDGKSRELKRLEDWLEDHAGLQTVIARERERRSRDRLLIANIISSLRVVSSADWKDEYESLCRAERNLLLDEVYSMSDENSKSAIRKRVCRISRETGLSEWTVSRHAVEMARRSDRPPYTTCCYWLYDDDGYLALKNRLVSADDDGSPRAKSLNFRGSRQYMACFFALFIGIFLLACEIAAWRFAIPFIILSWRYAHRLLDFIVTRLVSPRQLLKLDFKRVPDEQRTLVVLPALLSSVKRAKELARQLETLGYATKEDAVEYLLLGDFKDSDRETDDGDEAIIAAARFEIDEANRRDGKKRYHYLHRERVYVENDSRWMAKERKRGALMELNELLIGFGGKFGADGADADALRGRFKYVLTLDADARLLPTSQRELIGAIAHPVNRRRTENGVKKGYSVIAPRVEQRAENRFSRLVAYPGGLDAYPMAASEAYWDMCGQAAFCGKGIYDVRDFYFSLNRVVPDYAILSHDLLEGALSGAGLAGDVVALDDFPKTPAGLLKRLDRWTRGDWQLLPYIFKLPIPPLGRFMMVDNLVSSLAGIAAVVTIIISVQWGLAWPFIFAMIEPARGVLNDPKRCLAAFALLPETAWASVRAAFRAVTRMRVKRGLLDWTPAADSDDGQVLPYPGKIAAVLMLPGLFQGPFAPFAAAVGLVFWSGMKWLSGHGDMEIVPDEQKKKLFELACQTWRYFERVVPADSNGLPPDNMQIDPPAPIVKRTSPTNISMYIASCLCASELGIVPKDEAEKRVERTIATVEGLEKWSGQLYNWYDTENCRPLEPKYVSSVDSGNLAAGLLLASAMTTGGLSDRCETLARNMDLTSLYDEKKDLFYIGRDVNSGRVSDSHYDLLASESRILSLVAIALGQVPEKHWRMLGRGMNSKALISWSGTMFEYLMPELFTRSKPGTLLYESNKAVVDAQARRGASGVWGISESGYYAFDSAMNYQYRAFGLDGVSFRSGGDGLVISPYSTLLALRVDPEKSLENLAKMEKMGWVGEYGLYEAADFDPDRVPRGDGYKLVKSYMTHHQGMIMMAATDEMTDGAISGAFSNRPDIRAWLPLLEQRPQTQKRRAMRERSQIGKRVKSTSRKAGPLEGHLLEGGGITVFLRGDGRGFMRRGDLAIDRFCEGMGPYDGQRTAILINGEKCLMTDVRFAPGIAKWAGSAQGVAARLTVTVSGTDGAVYRLVEIENVSAESREILVTNAFAVSLAGQESYISHPAFMNMFVWAEEAFPGCMAFERKGRDRVKYPRLYVSAHCPEKAKVEVENDLCRLIGRRGGLDDPGAFPEEMAFTPGSTLNPCAAYRVSMTVEPGEKAQMVFKTALCDDGANPPRPASARDVAANATRAGEFARSRLLAACDFLSIDADDYKTYDARSSALFYPREGENARPGKEVTKNDLFKSGLDVVNPIIAAFVSSEDGLKSAKRAADSYLLYAALGVKCDLALVCDEEPGYVRPVRDGLEMIIAACGAGDYRRGKAVLIDGRDMDARQHKALRRAAAIVEEAGSVQTYATVADAVADSRLEIAVEPDFHPAKADLARSSGFGGFTRDASQYVINTCRDFPAPWCNVLANEGFGAVVSERGCGFCWAGNSRLGRITPWTGDQLGEGIMDEITLEISDGRRVRLIPATPPARVRHCQGATLFESAGGGMKWNFEVTVPREAGLKITRGVIENASGSTVRATIRAKCGFLMGADPRDARLLALESGNDMVIAYGEMPGVGFLALDAGNAKSGTVSREITLKPGEKTEFTSVLGWAGDAEEASRIAKGRYPSARDWWNEVLSRVEILSPDAVMNGYVGRWLCYQTMSSRIFARAGFYQAGGAYGFRDQLQDALMMILLEPEMAKKHILKCAGRQFEQGDVLHWWHPPTTGVRTRISDDCVFLPYVTARYVLETGDSQILDTGVPYLEGEALKDGQDDLYGAFKVSGETGTLHEHCMKAIIRASETGEHGLPKMMGGDWNDGMNRVNGESVWLAEFLAATCDDYALAIGSMHPEDGMILKSTSVGMKKAVEDGAWDGAWYRRAYYANGDPLGSASSSECKIDIVSQSWAVLAGLDGEHCEKAMDSAWRLLVTNGVIRLLTPPFTRNGQNDPGYISDYPPGVRENGGQYTHAACWAIMAWAKLNQADRAWKAFRMLLPYSHATGKKESRRYKVEPYALPADVYSESYMGRGGWTWYTGASAWLYRAYVYSLMGFEKRGKKARMAALIPDDWPEAGLKLRVGSSVYTMVSRRSCEAAEIDGAIAPDGYIELNDDGKEHFAVFPPRSFAP